MKNLNFLQELLKKESYFYFSFANTIATSSHTDIKIEINNGDEAENGDQEIIGIMISFVSKDASSKLSRNIIEITNPVLWDRKLNDRLSFYRKVKLKVGDNYSDHGDLDILFLFKDFPRSATSDDITEEYNRLKEVIKWLLEFSESNNIEEFSDFRLIE